MSDPHKSRLSNPAAWIITLVIAVAAIALFVIVGRSPHTKTAADATPATSIPATPRNQPTPTSAPAPSAAATATPAGPTACTTSQLALHVLPGSGAAGTEYYSLSLTNDSQVTCTLTGYPGASLVNAAGAQLGPAANRDTVSAVNTLTLGIGQAAYATLGLPNPGNYTAGSCGATSTSLKIYPPGQTGSLLIDFAAEACPGWTITAVHTTQP